MQLSWVLSLATLALLAGIGQHPYLTEFRGCARQTSAALMLAGILALTVFLPVTSFDTAAHLDPDTIWFPSLFIGHAALTVFLIAWWRLRRDRSLTQFLGLRTQGLVPTLRQGILTGVFGWMLTVVVTGAVATLVAPSEHLTSPVEMPPLMAWLAALPAGHKLILITVAMTVEEAFFRSFLQTRFGLFTSSAMFACGHFSYGLPFMIVGVFTISLVIGRTFQRSGNVLPCVIAHGVFDAVQLFLILPWVLSAREMPVLHMH